MSAIQAADGSLVQLLALEAVGQKSGHGHDRVVAIHALGTLAGAERLGRASSAGDDEPSSPHSYSLYSDHLRADLEGSLHSLTKRASTAE